MTGLNICQTNLEKKNSYFQNSVTLYFVIGWQRHMNKWWDVTITLNVSYLIYSLSFRSNIYSYLCLYSISLRIIQPSRSNGVSHSLCIERTHYHNSHISIQKKKKKGPTFFFAADQGENTSPILIEPITN